MEPVNGIIPGHGFHVNWLGLWAEIADGVSLENVKVLLRILTILLLQHTSLHTFSQLCHCDTHLYNCVNKIYGDIWTCHLAACKWSAFNATLTQVLILGKLKPYPLLYRAAVDLGWIMT